MVNKVILNLLGLNAAIAVNMSTRTNSLFLAASMTEFIMVWAMGGEDSLSLTASEGFNCTLSLPGAP